jgi:hypothetical protein
MKVYIGPYRTWIGPFQIAEFLLAPLKLFPKYQDGTFKDGTTEHFSDLAHKFGDWLAGDRTGKERIFGIRHREGWLMRLCEWIHSKQKRKVKVRIDRYDTWSMDSTLAYIILPMLKKLKEEKHGDPFTKDEDVPEHLRSTNALPKENDWDTDSLHVARWDWIMDEMIWAFEQINDDDNDAQFHTGVMDTTLVPVDKDGNEVPKEDALWFAMKEGPNHTAKTDIEAMKVHYARIENGTRLFGVYYRALWD